MKKGILFFVCMMIMAVVQLGTANAAMNEVNLSTDSSGFAHITGINIGTQLEVQTLKYEPYPVNAGEWFDLWVKVENIGRDDARKTRFEIVPKYPFSAESDLVREYGIIPGTLNAYLSKDPSESKIQSNQVIMKFRLKTADNAPEGTSFVTLKMNSGESYDYSVSLPISIGKTKTDFDVVMQDSTTQGTSFAIANTGSNLATAVIVAVDQNSTKVSGTSSSVLGNLAAGDFTTFTFNVLPDRASKSVRLDVSYTDIAGIRNTIQKNIPFNEVLNMSRIANGNAGTNGAAGFGARTTKATVPPLVYISMGIIIGVLLSLIYLAISNAKKKHLHQK